MSETGFTGLVDFQDWGIDKILENHPDHLLIKKILIQTVEIS
jgi:hypothetical protein